MLAGTIGVLLFALDPPGLQDAGADRAPTDPEGSQASLGIAPWLSPERWSEGATVQAGVVASGTF